MMRSEAGPGSRLRQYVNPDHIGRKEFALDWENRLYLTDPAMCNSLRKGQLESPFMAAGWKIQLRDVAATNGLSSVVDKHDQSCLSSQARADIFASMNTRVEQPGLQSTVAQRRAYDRYISALSTGHLTLARDDQAVIQRNDMAGLLLQNWVLHSIDPSQLKQVSQAWQGKLSTDYYSQLHQVIEFVDTFDHDAARKQVAIRGMIGEIKKARTKPQMVVLMAQIEQLMLLEKNHITNLVLKTVQDGVNEDTGEPIIKEVLVIKPKDPNFPHGSDAWWLRQLELKTSETSVLQKERSKLGLGIKKGWNAAKTLVAIRQVMAEHRPEEATQPTAAATTTVHRANVASFEAGASASTLLSSAHAPAMQQLDMELLHADIWTPNPYPAAAATFEGDDYDHPSHSHQIQANVAGQQRRMQPDHQLEPPLQRQRLADRSPLPPTNRPPICQHFLENRCTFGSNCRMSHDTTGLQPVYMGPQQYQMYQLGQMESNQRQQQSQQREQDYGFGPLHPTGRYVQPQQQQQQQPPPTHPHFLNHWRPGNGAGGK